MLILERPWTRQPQVVVGIDWSKSVTKGLVHCYLNNREVVKAVNPVNGSAITRGPSWITCSGTQNLALGANIGALDQSIAANSAWTKICLVKPSSLAVRNTPIGVYGGGVSIGIGMGYTTSSKVFVYPGNATGYTTEYFDGYWVAGEWITAGASFDNAAATKTKIYKNGVSVGAVTTNSPGAVYGSFTTISIGYGYGSNTLSGWIGDVQFIGIWNRMLSDVEHATVAQNPWQLFAPRRIYIPTAAAAAGAPTITALSARSITATSAQPRITYS